MSFRKLILAAIAVCSVCYSYSAIPVKVGVLAYRGKEYCLKSMSPMIHYLDQKVPGYSFSVVPLGYGDIDQAVARHDVDFIFTHSASYVELEQLYGVSRLATVIKKWKDKTFTVYAGVLFANAKSPIKDYPDLKGKVFMATSRNSFVGWWMAWRELKEAGIDPDRDFKALKFEETNQDDVVNAVIKGQADAGVVRAEVLADMIEEGKIDPHSVRIIHEQHTPLYPFAFSTRLYPEWPFAKLKQTDERLARKVASVLLQESPENTGLKSGEYYGWTVPLDYTSIHECLKELHISIYKDYGKINLIGLFKQYQYLILVFSICLLIMMIGAMKIIQLNSQLKSSRSQLESTLENLHRMKSRPGK